MMLCIWSILLLAVKAASFFSTLTDEKILKWAELCHEVYGLTGTNDQMTATLHGFGHICAGDKVIMQGFRNGGQLSSIVIKTKKKNHFRIL